jgi:cytochrome b561
MKLTNTPVHFGLITILIHWIMALIIIGLFVLGKYMVDLDYYDNYYHIAPWWHKSFGLLIGVLLLIRIVWRINNPKVNALSNYKPLEIKAAQIMQYLLYLLILICCISGYLISTAEDAGVSFFDWFEIPAVLSNGEQQADLAGVIHEYSTLALIILAGFHALAALKHHFIDKDKTLIRIFKTT